MDERPYSKESGQRRGRDISLFPSLYTFIRPPNPRSPSQLTTKLISNSVSLAINVLKYIE